MDHSVVLEVELWDKIIDSISLELTHDFLQETRLLAAFIDKFVNYEVYSFHRKIFASTFSIKL